MVKVAVREHDVRDVAPRRAHSGECPADRLAATRGTGVDEYDATRLGDDETADLEADRIGPEHPWGNMYLGDHGLDRRHCTSHRHVRSPAGTDPNTATVISCSDPDNHASYRDAKRAGTPPVARKTTAFA